MFCCDVFICIFFTRTAVLAATARQRRTTAQPGTCTVRWHFFYCHLIFNWNYHSVQISILAMRVMSHKKDCAGEQIHRRIDDQWHRSVARNITSNIITNSTHHGPVPLVMLGHLRLLLTYVLDHQRSTQPTGCHLGFVGMYLGLGTSIRLQPGSVWEIFPAPFFHKVAAQVCSCRPSCSHLWWIHILTKIECHSSK